MQEKLIYVFSEEDKNTLLSLGCVPVKSDEDNSVFVFVMNEKANFSLTEIKDYMLSNTLTF